ncbi:MAG: hypothetical protein ABSE82_14730, partial [Nitrososphaerales archaeon]
KHAARSHCPHHVFVDRTNRDQQLVGVAVLGRENWLLTEGRYCVERHESQSGKEETGWSAFRHDPSSETRFAAEYRSRRETVSNPHRGTIQRGDFATAPLLVQSPWERGFCVGTRIDSQGIGASACVREHGIAKCAVGVLGVSCASEPGSGSATRGVFIEARL